MNLTSKQVEGDFLAMLQGSSLATELSGGIYRQGLRPRDSNLEDAVVVFTAGRSDEIQSGVVTIVVFVPDVAPYGNGVFVEDGARVEQLQGLASEWVQSLDASKSNYRIRLENTITSHNEEESKQHFISVVLRYDYYDNQ